MHFAYCIGIKMKTGIPFSHWILSIIIAICAVERCHSFLEFQCLKNRNVPLPDLPLSFSTNIRVNFHTEKYTVQIKNSVKVTTENETTVHKEIFDLKTANRRTQYILRSDQKSVLVIRHKEDEHPKCEVKKSLDMTEFMDSVDQGPSAIIIKTAQAMIQQNNFFPAGAERENGVGIREWEGCFSKPKINVSVSFADSSWNQSHVSSLEKTNYIESIKAQIDNQYMTALYSNFDPETPEDSVFQPPADVYCESFRTDKLPPEIPNYFSYDAEILSYENAFGIDPIITRVKVYYDFPAGLSRLDFYEALSEDFDMFSPIIAEKKSIIHDFNAGIQYSIDPFSGKCILDTFQSTFTVISSKETKDGGILTANEFFWLDNSKLSYNGQFPIRGITADLFTTSKVDPQTKKKAVVSWYFSTEGTQVVETENVEKKVLLRMTVRPETDLGKEGVTIVNFYNFAKEEPTVLAYDITSCYNESYSKILVLTFPAYDSLRGTEKLIGSLTHSALKYATGLRKQRIFIKEVIFSDKYMYTEFDVLEAPTMLVNHSLSGDISLEDGIKNLTNAINKKNFVVNVPVGNESIALYPEPDGLNVFAGDRIKKIVETGYKEGSVIGMAVGMLFLGILLGVVTLNLIMNRRFGVSLFQKAKYGNRPFGSDGESKM